MIHRYASTPQNTDTVFGCRRAPFATLPWRYIAPLNEALARRGQVIQSESIVVNDEFEIDNKQLSAPNHEPRNSNAINTNLPEQI